MLRTRLRQGYNDYFKVYMGDMGLFVSMLEYGTQADILSGNLLGYNGAIFENLFADIFTKMGRKLYFFLTLSMRHPISVSQSSDSMRYAMLRSSCDV